jgi:hypothetical protein
MSYFVVSGKKYITYVLLSIKNYITACFPQFSTFGSSKLKSVGIV